MYVPELFRERDHATLVAFMKRYTFATVISQASGTIHATHLPLSVHEGESIWLRGHFARANLQWQMLQGGETLVVFAGPHAYISPEQYDQYESVPTWNYMAVHAYGEARLLEMGAGLEASLAALSAQYESTYQSQWESMSERYKQGMMRGIVAFELRVTRLEGTVKLSQNRSLSEQKRITETLLASDNPGAVATGTEMRRRLAALGER